jgi:hypothetical protein
VCNNLQECVQALNHTMPSHCCRPVYLQSLLGNMFLEHMLPLLLYGLPSPEYPTALAWGSTPKRQGPPAPFWA